MPIYQGKLEQSCNVPDDSPLTDIIDLVKWDAKLEVGEQLLLPNSMIEIDIENIRIV